MSVYRSSFKRDGKTIASANFYVEIRDHVGRRQVVAGFADKHATRALEAKLRKLVALRASGATPDEDVRRWTESLAPSLRDRLAEIGLLTPGQTLGLRPLSELRGEWKKHLLAEKRTKKYVANATAAVKRVHEGIGAKFWSELDASRVETFLRGEREKTDEDGNPDGIGARASNFLLGAARAFCRWCVRTGIATEDPLRILRPLNVAEDRRRERRALTPEELAKLIDAAEKGEDIDGMSGPRRALLYRLASETGLRRGELLSLVVADLDVEDEGDATVRLKAANAKNGREAHIPLRAATAKLLKPLVEHALPLARVFDVSGHWRAFDAIQTDLKAAEVPYRDAAGRVADFHALRTTFCTNLARGGVSLQLAQRLMRHSDPRLTSNVYTVLSKDDERAAVAALPVYVAPTPTADAATGTDGAVRMRASMRELEGGKGPDRAGSRRDAEELVGVGASNSEGSGLGTGASDWHARRDSNPQPADPKPQRGVSGDVRRCPLVGPGSQVNQGFGADRAVSYADARGPERPIRR